MDTIVYSPESHFTVNPSLSIVTVFQFWPRSLNFQIVWHVYGAGEKLFYKFSILNTHLCSYDNIKDLALPVRDPAVVAWVY